MIKIHFKGSSGIESPVDVDGKFIKEGDILTGDWFDNSNHDWMTINGEEREKRFHRPTYVVKKSEKGLYAESLPGINYLYLHDFRFKFTKVVSVNNV